MAALAAGGAVIVDDPLLLQALPKQVPLKLLQNLEGTWTGTGVGEYPPHVPRFQFLQQLDIERAVPHGPRELVWAFRSVTWSRETREGLQSEHGYLRFHPDRGDRTGSQGTLEISCCHPSGLCEVSEGTYTEDSFDAWTRFDGLARPRTATRPYVTEVRRHCELRLQCGPPVMSYRVDMATERTPMQQHLLSTLRRQDDGEPQ